MVVLTAYAHIQPDKVNAALVACRKVRSASVLEPGCERYDFFQSPDDPTKIVFVEEWTSYEDLQLHFQQAAFQEFMGEMAALVQAESEIRIFDSTLLK